MWSARFGLLGFRFQPNLQEQAIADGNDFSNLREIALERTNIARSSTLPTRAIALLLRLSLQKARSLLRKNN